MFNQIYKQSALKTIVFTLEGKKKNQGGGGTGENTYNLLWNQKSAFYLRVWMTLNTFLGGDIDSAASDICFLALFKITSDDWYHDYNKFMMMTTTKKTKSMAMTNLGETITLR